MEKVSVVCAVFCLLNFLFAMPWYLGNIGIVGKEWNRKCHKIGLESFSGMGSGAKSPDSLPF